jgi:hypothetical protein
LIFGDQWLCNVSNLDQIYKFSTIYCMGDLHISYINHSQYLGDQYKPRMVWERSISGYVAVLFQILGVQFSE